MGFMQKLVESGTDSKYVPKRISQWQKGWLVLDTEEKITPSYIIIG